MPASQPFNHDPAFDFETRIALGAASYRCAEAALLTCPKTLIAFTAAEAADSHCEPMAPTLRNARVFDWLEATLGAPRA